MFKKCKKLSDFSKPVLGRVMVSSRTWLLALSTPVIWGTVGLISGCEQIPMTQSTQASKHNSSNQADTNAYSKQFSAVIDAHLPAPTQILDCNDMNPNQTITITGHTQLKSGCNLTAQGVQFVLDSSNTSLDCQGARLSPQEKDSSAKGSSEKDSSKTAITIRPKEDVAIANISVANCHVQGYGHALNIRQYSNPNQRYAKGFIDPDANRALAPHDIHITNVSAQNSINSGIFVGDHVHHVTFDHLRVQGAGTVGLYLEFGSQHNVIQNSVFVDNGFRTFKPNREAIAVDSSAFNSIKNNQFIHNGAGSILLYRNCFEHANDPSRSNHFKRTESAANNLIEGNKFADEPVGVWVAARQSRNLKGFECGAYLLAETPFASYYLDSAKDNRIIGNTFVNVDEGIIVEDDGTDIRGNDFTQINGTAIKVGSEIREKYANNAKGISPQIQHTTIKDNMGIEDKQQSN